ncbi:MAG: class I SAM-dependent methyltransferase [Pseudomonadota bacterium]|nr:class I SAM-dependent methyltransferase [Pseudomonadota bacterium]
MADVASSCCDLIFSGQNVEHLWPDEVTGFLFEAARVLRPGGHLVIDSPNRLITAPSNWSNPEHTIELTIAEIRQLLALAGFEVSKTAGIWLCQDPRSGRLLPFDPNVAELDWSITERLIAARDRPEQSFIWWIEARRGGQDPDRDGVERLMAETFRAHWPERIRRLHVPDAHRITTRPDGEWVVVPPGQAGWVFFGPYMPLRAGSYSAEFTLEPVGEASETTGAPFAVCEVVWGDHSELLARQEVGPSVRSVRLDFELPMLRFGIQFRCFALGRAGFAVRKAVALDESLAMN